MLDETRTGFKPPRHEPLRLEEFQLFRVRLGLEDVADFYQIRSGIDERVEGFDLLLGEPLPWMVLQANLGEIAVQAQPTRQGLLF